MCTYCLEVCINVVRGDRALRKDEKEERKPSERGIRGCHSKGLSPQTQNFAPFCPFFFALSLLFGKCGSEFRWEVSNVFVFGWGVGTLGMYVWVFGG